MATGDDLENRMPVKDQEIGSNGGDRSRFRPPPGLVVLTFSKLSGDESSLWTSWLVPVIFVVNLVLFFVEMFVNNCPKNSEFPDRCFAKFLGRFSFERLHSNPLLGPSTLTMLKVGGQEWGKIVMEHEAWRLVTCLFLHTGVVHVTLNMLGLLFIGIRLEQQFGFVRIGVIYLISGIGGNILSLLFIRNSVSVGASGAIFGLLGSTLSELLTNWAIYSNKIAALLLIVLVNLANLASGFLLPGVDNFGHVGGFLTGFLLGFVLMPRPQYSWLARQHMPQGLRIGTKYKPYQYALGLLSLAIVIVGFVVGFVMVFRAEDGNDYCSWCRYLRCVPISRRRCDD